MRPFDNLGSESEEEEEPKEKPKPQKLKVSIIIIILTLFQENNIFGTVARMPVLFLTCGLKNKIKYFCLILKNLHVAVNLVHF